MTGLKRNGTDTFLLHLTRDHENLENDWSTILAEIRKQGPKSGFEITDNPEAGQSSPGELHLHIGIKNNDFLTAVAGLHSLLYDLHLNFELKQ